MKQAKKPIKRQPDQSHLSKKKETIPTHEDDAELKDQAVEAANHFNRVFRKELAKRLGPVDIPAFSRSFFDGFIHLLWSPGTILKKHYDLMVLNRNLFDALLSGGESIAKDRRFTHPGWEEQPFAAYKSTFLTIEPHVQDFFSDVRGVQKQSRLLIEFMLKQLTAMFNPINFPFTNPEVIEKTIEDKGTNLLKGFGTFLRDINTEGKITIKHSKEEYHRVGETIAATKGRVVFKNELIELIQFEAKTDKVQNIPVFLLPAWINKYYVLDLSHKNSLAKYLVEQGFTVFTISWKNADKTMGDNGIVEYMNKGVITAIEQIKSMTGSKSLHMAGYCMGAILGAIAAAHLRGNDDDSIKTLTFLATQLDFTDAGELKSFIDESQIAFLEDLMIESGYLDKANMADTFSLLKPRDLFWNYLIDTYFLAKEPFNFDFLYWNDDGTRIPTKLHVEMLERLYLEDELTEGKFRIDGKSLDLRDIDMDLYSVGTLKDHIAPWKSVYRTPHFVSSPIKFVLASSGHIVGIINPPDDNKGRYYTDGILGKGPDHWLETAKENKGSWWPDWINWLEERSDSKVPALKCPVDPKFDLGKAPGTYVFEK